MEEYKKYRYFFLQDQSGYWSRCRGITGNRGRGLEIVSNYYAKLEGTIDIPLTLLSTAILGLARGKSEFAFSFLETSYTYTQQARSYKYGLESALYRNLHRTLGEVTKVTPEVSENKVRVQKDPFYVGNGIVFDKKGKLIIGTFIRIKNNGTAYEPTQCVIKVSKKVFEDVNHPLHKILLKEALPEILSGEYKFYFPNSESLLEAFPGANGKELEIVLEAYDNTNVESMSPLPLDFSNEDLCKAALANIDKLVLA